jgi:antitoxin PrlF
MASSTITSKGQTTIPKSIRDRLGLKAGDRIEFLIEDGNRVVIIPATLPLAELAGCLPAPKRPVTLEEMDRAIRSRGGRSSKGSRDSKGSRT